MKAVVLLFICLGFVYPSSMVAQGMAPEDKMKPKPYCFAEVVTYQSFDDDAAVKLRKELLMRYSNIIILLNKQKVQFHICGKTDLAVEDKMIRSIFEKAKISLNAVYFSFVPFESNNVCEYPECE